VQINAGVAPPPRKAKYVIKDDRIQQNLDRWMGDADTQHVYTEHFKSLYQPNTSNANLYFANRFETLLNTTAAAGLTPFINTATINDCISSLKYRKTPGHDGISNEHITH